jgi:hypothetical protein
MLMSGIQDKHHSLCQKKITELASQLSPIEMEIGPPSTQMFLKRPLISCPVAWEGIVALREMIGGELKKALTGETPGIRFGDMRAGKETEYWRLTPFNPRVGICIRAKNEDEEIVNTILEEVKAKYPSGFGSVTATGLALY